MKRHLITAALLLSSVAFAHADTVSVFVQGDDLPSQTYTNVGQFFGLTYGPWQIGGMASVGGFEVDAYLPTGMNAVSDLHVYVTDQGQTIPYTGTAALNWNVRTLPSGWNVTTGLYADQNDGAFSGQLVDSDQFSAPTAPPGTYWTYPVTLQPGFSSTATFDFTLTGLAGEATVDGNFGNVNNQVPAPVIGAGLPGLLAAIGGFLAWRRRRHA
jgi:hypothetical protein